MRLCCRKAVPSLTSPVLSPTDSVHKPPGFSPHPTGTKSTCISRSQSQAQEQGHLPALLCAEQGCAAHGRAPSHAEAGNPHLDRAVVQMPNRPRFGDKELWVWKLDEQAVSAATWDENLSFLLEPRWFSSPFDWALGWLNYASHQSKGNSSSSGIYFGVNYIKNICSFCKSLQSSNLKPLIYGDVNYGWFKI